ncbi:O-antigen ligase family protein [Sphingomonas sp. RHCKR7]|uniref:O-antigen ligase family protein n=1 Tax=Sphingomonas folli TaxID=2862497 RepID=UPI001CA58BCA|nr:O-antigen ligase family protein [Sphingomonas folli]MBW6528609.1 O-antigen ligase family protein [Sphingomonas folli]
MTAAVLPNPRARVAVGAEVPRPIILAVALSSYLSWRPSLDIMFTLSDVLFLLGLGLLASRHRLPLQPFGALQPAWLMSFTVMMGGLLVASLGARDPSRWLIVAMQYAFAWVVLPFAIAGHGRAYATVLARALVAGMVAMEAFGILIYVSFQASFEVARKVLGLDFLSGNRRLGVFATDANWNGAAIAMTLPFVLFLWRAGRLRTAAMLAAFAVLLVSLLLTASFTAFSSAAIGLAVFGVIAGIRLPRWVVGGLFAAALVVSQTGLMLPETFNKRVAGAIENGDISEAGTFTGRVALIDDAWSMIEQHPFSGVGVDQHRVISKLKAPVHNMYLLVWVEGGLVALLGWLGMLVVLVMVALSTLRRERDVAGLVLAVLVTFLIFSAASPHMYARLWSVPVILSLAMAHGGAARRPPRALAALVARRAEA